VEGGRPPQTAAPGRAGFALRFLTGRYRGGTVTLETGVELVIGRLRESGLVLPEELTSRRHARVVWEGGAPVVEDLGSTNGTFVNGERVKRRRLAAGDRLLVGGNILKLVTEQRPAPGEADTMPGLERVSETPLPRRQSAMQGLIEEVGLADVLQLCATTRKSGVLEVRRGEARATIHLGAGRVVRAAIAGRPGLSPRDVFAEMLEWTDGSFELDAPPAEPPPGPALDEPVEALLMDALRVLDEKRRVR
jgi:pSer/pThr/pTyr-binding forkhead associated (FHA) protein